MSEFEDIVEIEELKRQNAKLASQLRKAKAKSDGFYEAARDGARDASLALGRAKPVPVFRARKTRKDAKPEIALLHLSDWQLGKLNSTYNTEIAKQRVAQVGDLTVSITGIERSDHPVRDCHVLLGGDFVEGVNIFPGQQAEVDSSLFEQTAAAAFALVELLRQLCGAFEQVHCWEEDGNHGRIGRRGEFPKDNADQQTYFTARVQLTDLLDDKRLVWHERKGWYTIAEIGAYRALLVHGDEVKSFGGNTPAFGIARKVASWATGVIEPFTDAYMGHWHQPLVIPLPTGHRRTFVNPSIESGNAYAQEFVGSTGSPGQRLNFVEPVRGRVTAERILWLD